MKEIEKLRPLPRLIHSFGVLPDSYVASMSYHEQLTWFCNYLQTVVIPTVNNNAEAGEELQSLFTQLQEYVDTYFDNLDVQEEINNKIDDLIEDGTFTEIIKNYLDPIQEEFEGEVDTRLNSMQNQINSVASGSPLVASSTSGMTDTTRTYVNTTDGYWYYYNGSAWTQGGVYQARVQTSEVEEIENTISMLGKGSKNLVETVLYSKLWDNTGLHDNVSYNSSDKFEVEVGRTIYISENGNPFNARFIYFDENNDYLSTTLSATSSTVPADAKYCAVSVSFKYSEFQCQYEEVTDYLPYNTFKIDDKTIYPRIDNIENYTNRIFGNNIKLSNNLFNKNSNEIIEGHYIGESGQVQVNASYFITHAIPVTEEEYLSFTSCRFISFYNHGSFMSTTSSPVSPVQIPENCTNVKLSVANGQRDTLMINKGQTRLAYENYNTISISDFNANITYDYTKFLQEIRKEKLKTPIIVEKDSLTTGNTITLESNSIKTYKQFTFNALITTFSKIIIGHGKTSYSGNYIEIDSSSINVYKYTNSASLVHSYTHGLTITGLIGVTINTYSTTADIILTTLGGTYKITNVAWSGTNGSIFIESSGSTLINITASWNCTNYNSDIWLFGDSYVSMSNNRYPYILRDLGYTNYLINGYPGQDSSSAYNNLVTALTHGTPKILVWALGMNNQDNESSINSTWQSITENVMSLCEQLDIELILVTIPNTPERINYYKNQYIINSDYRYIDLAESVGATEIGSTWYTGLLEDTSTGIHPTEQGAKVMANKILSQLPELTK